MSKKSFLNALSNKVLDEKLIQLVSGEIEILTEIIIHIREVKWSELQIVFEGAIKIQFIENKYN